MFVPPAVVTLTPTEPAAPAGAVTVSWLSDTTVGTAVLAPKETLVALEKPVPLMVMVSPPAVDPEAGLRVCLNGAPT